MFDFDKFEKKHEEEHQIKCPYCGYVFEDGEDMYPFISMWGEDSCKNAICPACDKEFTVNENVDRYWEVSK